MKGYGKAVRRILRDAECKFLRQGRGDHEVWTSPHARKAVHRPGDHRVPTHGEQGVEGCRLAEGILSGGDSLKCWSTAQAKSLRQAAERLLGPEPWRVQKPTKKVPDAFLTHGPIEPRTPFPLDGAGSALAAAPGDEEALMATVHVLAIITARPGKRAELLAAFQANVPNVRAEDGCLEYVATVDAENADDVQTRFGPDYLRGDRAMGEPRRPQGPRRRPHMAAYAAKTKDLIASRVIHVLSPV